eukprot:Nitzschia sp. Nitz4//scaffold226_size53432//627//1333//NITZ4_006688-RA/size53432-augustus-gene-0.59-mRNA-1//-1//CDS//3329542712//4069//frame0
MRTSTLLSIAILLVSSLLAMGSDAELLHNQIERKTSSGDESVRKPPPKKPKPSTGGTTPAATDTSGSSGASGSSGSSSGGSGSSGSSSSSSSSSASSASSSSSSSSSSGSGSGSSTSSATTSGSLHAVTGGPAHRGTLVLLGAAAVAGVAIAAAAVPKRRVETTEHPLKGSLNRRINLFSNLAEHSSNAARPPRRGEDGAYVNADHVV